MSLNVILEIYFLFAGSVVQMFPIGLQVRHYLRTRYLASLFWALFYVSIFCFFLFNGLAQLFLFPPLLLVAGLILLILGSLSLNLVVDLHERTSIEPVRLAILAFLSCALIWGAASPGATIRTTNDWGEPVVIWGGGFMVVGTILTIFLAVFLARHGIRVYRYAKPYAELKTPARWLLVAVVCYWISGVGGVVPITGGASIQAISAVIVARTYSREPKLFFLLSFEVMRVSVVETEAGIPLFTHTWHAGQAMADDDLFSGMVQGVSIIIQESVGKGNIKVIELDEGILILKRVKDRPIACVLAATRSSKVLHQSLATFAARFVEKFAEALEEPHKVSQFQPAEDLVEECFPFIPQHK